MKNMNGLLIATSMALLVGCANTKTIERDVDSFENSVKHQRSDYAPLLIAADIQTHFIYNSINTRRNVFNKFSESIRPAAADLFANDVFRMVYDRFNSDNPNGKLIFLGDILDVSCDWEAEKFYSVMKENRNWVLVPGNHDFIFLGTHEKRERVNDWVNACFRPGMDDGKFNKIEYIFTYLEALSNQSLLNGADPSYKKFSECLSEVREDRRAAHKCLVDAKAQDQKNNYHLDRDCAAFSGLGSSWVNCKVATNIPDRFKNIPNQGWWRNNNKEEFLQDVFWYINPADEGNKDSSEPYYSYSFIVQRVRMPDGRFAVLLDTNNPAELRSVTKYLVGYNPANSANMLYSQMNAASFIMGGSDVFIKPGVPRGDLKRSEDEHVLMSHHPIYQYKWEARKGLCLLAAVGNVKSVYTAHTHKPGNYLHEKLHTGMTGCENVVEYNVGSMIDEPVEFMLVKQDAGSPRSVTVGLSVMDRVECDAEYSHWKRDSDSEYYYTSYDELGWFAGEEKVHKNLMLSVLDQFMEMLNSEYGFITADASWPIGYTSDDDVKKRLLEISMSIRNGTPPKSYIAEFIDLDKFFSERSVLNTKSMEKYKKCQLYWAAKAKSEI